MIHKIRNSPYLRDISFQASGNTIGQIIGIVSLPILTRLYSPSDFAVLNLFTQVVMLMNILLTLRLEYFINLPKENDNVYLLLKGILVIGFSTLIFWSGVVHFFSTDISKLLNEPLLSDWLILAPITALFMSISIAIQHLHQRNEHYKISGFSEIISKLGYVFSGVIGYLILPKSLGLMLAIIFSNFVKGAYLVTSLKKSIIKKVFLSFESCRAIGKTLFKYSYLSSSLTFSHIMLAFTTAIPVIFISNFYGKEILGQFSLVIATIYLPSSVLGIAIGQVYYQRAAKRYANGNNFNDLWKETANFLLVFGIPIYLFIGFLSPYAYPIIFGAEWYEAGQYATIVSISAFFGFITVPLDRGCLVTNRGWYVMLYHSLRVLTTFLIALLTSIFNWDFDFFLSILVCQMSLMYLFDYYANWLFSKANPLIEETLS
tara:strand:+ start:1118 stop:2410 length:1293 start_codon:yes stop_codon:yes gene_type:complete